MLTATAWVAPGSSVPDVSVRSIQVLSATTRHFSGSFPGLLKTSARGPTSTPNPRLCVVRASGAVVGGGEGCAVAVAGAVGARVGTAVAGTGVAVGGTRVGGILVGTGGGGAVGIGGSVATGGSIATGGGASVGTAAPTTCPPGVTVAVAVG